VQKTVAKRAVGAILQRRHIRRYVEEQNRKTSVAASFESTKVLSGILI
jgi:hypothetical protein